MTATATRPRAVAERDILRQLTVIQAKRYAAHPLFLGPLALLAMMIVALSDDATTNYSTLSDHVTVAFTIGVFGLLVAYRLTRTEDRALALLPSAPVPATTRTLALLGACLVPAGVGLLALIARYATWAAYPPPDGLIETAGGPAAVLAFQISGFVVACFGGPALGVAVGRWLRFPAAGVLVALALTLLTAFMSGGALQIPGVGENWIIRGLGTAVPWTDWVVISVVDGDTYLQGVRPGSPVGHLFYALSLCGLACWAAVMKDAVGDVRTRWVRLGALFGVTALVTYPWALLG